MKDLGSLKKDGSVEPYVRFLLRDDNILVMKWKGFVKGDLIKEAHEVVLEILEKNKITGLIEDVIEFSGPFSEVNEWFISYWVPKALENGLKKAGVLMNSNIFTQLSVEALKENPTFKELGLGYRIFDKMDNAVNWLQGKDLVNS